MWVFVVDTDDAVTVCICHKLYLFNIITISLNSSASVI